jgi:hypothetical protein
MFMKWSMMPPRGFTELSESSQCMTRNWSIVWQRSFEGVPDARIQLGDLWETHVIAVARAFHIVIRSGTDDWWEMFNCDRRRGGREEKKDKAESIVEELHYCRGAIDA